MSNSENLDTKLKHSDRFCQDVIVKRVSDMCFRLIEKSREIAFISSTVVKYLILL